MSAPISAPVRLLAYAILAALVVLAFSLGAVVSL